MTNQLCRGILRSLAAVHNHASARCSPALQQLRSTSPKCWHLGPKVDARLNHTSLPDSFKTIFGNEQKNVLQARGTVLRPKEDSPLEIDINELPVEKLRKLDVCRRYNLQPRDLGALDTDFSGSRAQIFVRPGGSIVFSASTRAVIRHDKVLLLEALEAPRQGEEGASQETGSSELARYLALEMRKVMVKDRLTLPEGSSEQTPFEFIALEALLADTMHKLLKTSTELHSRFSHLMDTFRKSETIPTSALQAMVEMKDSLEAHKAQTEDFKAVVSDVLGEEADMASMYLTAAANGRPRTVGDDDEIELLLESYRHHAYALASTANTLLSRLQSINNHVTLLLSTTRNRLLNLEITIAFATLGMSAAAFVGAVFGMNLKSGLEDEPHVFVYMTGFSLMLALLVMRTGRRALVKARSIKGEQQSLLQHPSAPIRGQHLSKSKEA